MTSTYEDRSFEVCPVVNLEGPWRNPASEQRVRDRARERYRDRHSLASVRSRKHKRQARREMIREYGGACVCCGEREHEFLTMDHVNNDGAAHRKANPLARSNIALYLKREGWPKDGFALLCYNCNCGKQRNGGVCPHERLRGE